MTTVRLSDDALALACGADAVAAAFERAGCSVERVSSWGMAGSVRARYSSAGYA